MNNRDQKLESLGYPLDQLTPTNPLYDSVAISGNTVYASGQVPFNGDQLTSVGRVPSVVSVEEATDAAALCAANVLRAVRAKVGSLDKIKRVVRLTGYVNSDPDFTDCHLIIHGASRLVLEIFGDAGKHARTALAMQQLPLGVSVEVEMILELDD